MSKNGDVPIEMQRKRGTRQKVFSVENALIFGCREPQEAAVMEQKQEAVLEALGIRRPPYGE